MAKVNHAKPDFFPGGPQTLALGVLYSRLSPHLRANPIAKGLLFGLGVWGITYYGLPALGVRAMALKLTPARSLMMMLAHAAWGATLGAAESKMHEPRDEKIV